MKRPYTVCHIFSALDGAIVGNYMATAESRAAQKQYGEKRGFFNCNAILYGTTTMLDFCDGYVESLPETMPAAREDYVSPDAKASLVIATGTENLRIRKTISTGTAFAVILSKCLPKTFRAHISIIFAKGIFPIFLRGRMTWIALSVWKNCINYAALNG